MPAAKKSKKNDGSASGALTSTTIDDLTALTTAQLYSLSSRRHRDEARDAVRRAQEERDRAYGKPLVLVLSDLFLLLF